MKKSFYLFLIFPLLFISCGDDDESSNDIDASLIVGTWTFEDLQIDSSFSSTFAGETETGTVNYSLISSTGTVTFNADGTYTSQGENTFLIEEDGFDDETEIQSLDGDNGTYVINGNTIVLTGDSFDIDEEDFPGIVYTITTLSDSRLVIEVEGSASGTEDGFTFSAEIDGFYEFSK